MFKDNFTLTVSKDISFVRETLRQNTLNRTSLSREITTMPLIGQIKDNAFLIITSSKLGTFSKMIGKFEMRDGNTIVQIETRIQKAFIALFIFAVLVMAVPVFIKYFLDMELSLSITPFIQWLVFGLLFYYLFRGAYSQSRNIGIKEIEKLLY